MGMINELTNPVEKTMEFGTVQLTHKAYGLRIIPWNKPRMESFTVLGIMRQGVFRAFPDTEETAEWKPADIQAVDWDNVLVQILARHDFIIARQILAGTNP